MRGQRIGVLCGGQQTEVPAWADPLEVEAAAGRAVWAALRGKGYDAHLIELGRDLDVALRARRIQVAFLASRARTGEDGSVQGLLELLGIPYTGSSVLASALALDCQKSRAVLRQHNLPTPPSYIIETAARTQRPDQTTLLSQHSGFGYPAVVRPRHDTPLCQPRVVLSDDGLSAAVAAICDLDDDVVVERHGAGRTVAVAILNGKALGAMELLAAGGRAGREEPAVGVVPPRISPERLRGVAELAVRTAAVLGCTGPARVDVLVSDRSNELVLSVNPRPSIAPGSLLGRVAAAVGLPFEDLCEGVLAGAVLHGRRPRTLDLVGPSQDRRVGEEAMLYNGPDRRTLPISTPLGCDTEVA